MNINKTMVFRVPDGYRYDEKITAKMKDGFHYGKVPAISWFTNLDIPKRHEPIDLRGNYYDAEKYPKYVNFDGIEVSKINDIPCDYDGNMGVPITFLDKYCPEQFEIVGISSSLATKMKLCAEPGTYQTGGLRFYTTNLTEKDKEHGYLYHREYDRIVIRKKKGGA